MSPPLRVLALLAIVVAGAVAPAAAGGDRVVNGVYRRPLGNDPETLDPARISDVYSRSVSQQIFDGLVQFDRTLSIAPALAQFWKASRDGLTWTFTLRKGVKFHHGREVTADDVVYSFTRILDPRVRSGAADVFSGIRGAADFRAGKVRHVAGITALDRYTVQVALDEAPVPFVSLLAVGHAKIVPREVVERDSDGFGVRPVGTGPFKFERWERGREIVLAANADYFDGAPRLARVVYRVFPGDRWEVMHEEFRRGALEDSPIPTQNYRAIIGRSDQIYVKRPMISLRFYGFNTRTKPLDDRRVRQAIVHAVDRNEVIHDVLLGRFTLARGILPPGTLGFNPSVRSYPYDLDRARALLAQAGYPGGRGLPPLVIWSSVRLEQLLREHERMKVSLEAAGIPVEFRYLTDWPAYSKMLADGKLPCFLYAWYADVPDPDNFLSKLFHSRSPRNFFGYANPIVDDMLVAARNEHDMSRRVDLYRRAEQLILDDAPILPIMHHTYERLFQPYVRSVEVSGLGDPYIPLRKIWLDRPER
ncbi:MAG: ABC transporter substrate-binding protein [Candidatus Rokuibacteriota bacterium]